MSTREKILVVGAVLALLYGAYEVGLKRFLTHAPPASGLKVSADAVRSGQETGLSGLISQAVEQARSVKPGTRENYIVRNRKVAWKSDPFVSGELVTASGRGEASSAGKGVKGAGSSLVYSGYLAMGGMKLAVINGREYGEGDILRDGGYVLRRIYPSKVVLSDGASTITVKLKQSGDGVK